MSPCSDCPRNSFHSEEGTAVNACSWNRKASNVNLKYVLNSRLFPCLIRKRILNTVSICARTIHWAFLTLCLVQSLVRCHRFMSSFLLFLIIKLCLQLRFFLLFKQEFSFNFIGKGLQEFKIKSGYLRAQKTNVLQTPQTYIQLKN